MVEVLMVLMLLVTMLMLAMQWMMARTLVISTMIQRIAMTTRVAVTGDGSDDENDNTDCGDASKHADDCDADTDDELHNNEADENIGNCILDIGNCWQQ